MRRREYKRGVIPAFAGLITAIYAGMHGTVSNINMSAVQYVLMMCITLGVPEALRKANAKSTSVTKVAGLSLTAFLFSSLMTAVIFALSFLDDVIGPMYYTLTTGGVLVCLRCLVEYFCATDDRTSALLTDILTGIAMITPAIMGFSGNSLTAVLAVDGVLVVALVVALVSGFKNVRTGERISLEVTLFQEISGSFIRVVLYPALVALMWIGGVPVNMVMPFCGLIMVELGRTAFRRDASENAGFTVNVVMIALLTAIADIIVPEFSTKMIFAAAFTLVTLYSAKGLRTVLTALLLLACMFLKSSYAVQFVPIDIALWLAFGCAAACMLLCIPEWSEIFRRNKAKRIRKRAMKARKR